MHAARLLVLLFIHTKYYQNMSKGIKVMERKDESTEFCFRGDNYIMEKVRLFSLTHDRPTGPLFHSYRILSSYLKTVWELWPAQDFYFRGDNYIMKRVRVISPESDTPTGPALPSYQI